MDEETRADHHYNELKNSGVLDDRSNRRALELQIQRAPTQWGIA